LFFFFFVIVIVIVIVIIIIIIIINLLAQKHDRVTCDSFMLIPEAKPCNEFEFASFCSFWCSPTTQGC